MIVDLNQATAVPVKEPSQVIASFFVGKQVDALRLTTDCATSRYALGGIHFQSYVENGATYIRASSTNGARLAVYCWEANKADSLPEDGVILVADCVRWASSRSVSSVRVFKDEAIQKVTVHSDGKVVTEFGVLIGDEFRLVELRVVHDGIVKGRFPRVADVVEAKPVASFAMAYVSPTFLIDGLKQAIAALDCERPGSSGQGHVCIAIPINDDGPLAAIRVVAGNGFKSVIMPLTKDDSGDYFRHAGGKLGTFNAYKKAKAIAEAAPAPVATEPAPITEGAIA